MISRSFVHAIIRAPAKHIGSLKTGLTSKHNLINASPALSVAARYSGAMRCHGNQASSAIDGGGFAENPWSGLHDLRNLSGDNKFAQQLIAALTPMVQAAAQPPSASELSRGLQGLGMLSSEQPEVRQLVAALVPQVKACAQRFRSDDVGAALSGLHRMSNQHSEVADLVHALALKVEACRNKVDFSNLALALSGLSNMTYDGAPMEFKRLVDWLILVMITRIQEDQVPQLLPKDQALVAAVHRSLQALMDGPGFAAAPWRDDVQELIDLMKRIAKP